MYVRKIRKCGNSHVVSVPKEIRKKMNISWGDCVIIVQEFSGKMNVFGIEDATSAYATIREKKGKSCVEVRRIMRQNRQTLIGIPKRDEKVSFFKIGENVELQLGSSNELIITRIVG